MQKGSAQSIPRRESPWLMHVSSSSLARERICCAIPSAKPTESTPKRAKAADAAKPPRRQSRALKFVAVAAAAATSSAIHAKASESGGRGEAAPPPVASAQIRHSIKPKHLFERHDRRIRAGDVIAHDKTDALTLSEALTTLGLSEELSSRRSVAWSLSR